MYETETECEAASLEWYDAECISTVWTLSPSQQELSTIVYTKPH